MDVYVNRSDELAHWGIKGQKWGVRRYQNPDGSYTEEGIKRYQKKYPYQNPDGSLTESGQKNFMKAARKNQLDYKHLSDKDLDMINNRFNKENQYKRNIENYEKSTFKYKAKEALVARIKGNGGGGGGKKGGGSNGLAGILAMPIKKAFEDAFKDVKGSGGGGGSDDGGESHSDNKFYRDYKKGHRFVNDFEWSKAEKKNRKRWEKEGKRFCDDAAKDWTSGNNRSTGNRTAEDVMRNRHKPMPKQEPKPKQTDEQKRQAREQANRRRERELEERLAKSGLILGHNDMKYVIVRDSSNELMHYGIKGQKWGVRRYENLDGTLTPEGKNRYRSDAAKARDEIGAASRDSRTGIGTGTASSMLSRYWGGKDYKLYKGLDRTVGKQVAKAGFEYGKNHDKKGKADEAALDFADAIASVSTQYINENFPESERDKAKAFVYARFVQQQDKKVRDAFSE